MPLKTEALEEPRIDLTSMLDVVMLLMIFFMIGTKFSENERVDVSEIFRPQSFAREFLYS